MALIQSTDVTVRKGRHFFINPDFLWPLAILAATTVAFNLFRWDIAIQRLFYTGSGHWGYGNHTLFSALYRYASFPGLILASWGLFMFIRGFGKGRIRRWRKVGLYLALVMAIGPGILVNSLLKDRWGRPRPRDILEFGGKHAYEAPLRYDPASPGKSFPSGHASVGFYFYVLYFLLKRRKPKLAVSAYIGATCFGLLIGLARIAQGGHFASDVIWAGALVYLCAAGFYYLLGLNKGLYWDEASGINRMRIPVVYLWGMYFICALVAALIFLATPFYRQHEYTWQDKLSPEKHYDLLFTAPSLDLRIDTGCGSILRTDTSGFGFPGSKISFRKEISQTAQTALVNIKQVKRGLFTELNCLAMLQVDSLRTEKMKASVQKGDISLHYPSSGKIRAFDLAVGTGDLVLHLPKDFADTLRVDGYPRITNYRKEIPITYGKPLAGKAWQVSVGRGKLIIR